MLPMSQEAHEEFDERSLSRPNKDATWGLISSLTIDGTSRFSEQFRDESVVANLSVVD